MIIFYIDLDHALYDHQNLSLYFSHRSFYKCSFIRVSDLYGGRRACVIATFMGVLCPLLWIFAEYMNEIPVTVRIASFNRRMSECDVAAAACICSFVYLSLTLSFQCTVLLGVVATAGLHGLSSWWTQQHHHVCSGC
jgi:hypothetical protein